MNDERRTVPERVYSVVDYWLKPYFSTKDWETVGPKITADLTEIFTEAALNEAENIRSVHKIKAHIFLVEGLITAIISWMIFSG